ncbi:MAG: hypothetical protein VB096_00465 [Pseudoflavonifractor sp.]|nr:hypothetical protein [Pseudoflavonifractor sp.]
MGWSKIKNIVILLLLIVNVCLLAIVGVRSWRTERAEQETRSRMVEILKGSGITFSQEEIPGELGFSGRRVSMTSFGETEAATLVGTITKWDTVGTRTTYTGERGSATFSVGGEIEVQFLAGAKPLEGADMGRACNELLESLGIQVEEAKKQTQGEMVTLVYTQLWEGTPVPDLTLTIVYRRGELSSLTGRYLAGNSETLTSGGAGVSATTALARFLEGLNRGGYVCSQVTEMYAGYAVSGTGTVTLTPTWYLETDAWPWRFAVNGDTGTVTAEE